MSLDQIQKFWDSYAEEYEKVALSATNQIFHQLLSFINLPACSAVLETGCGTGSGLEIMRKAVSNSCHLVGTDYSPVMVGKALGKNIENCEIKLEDSQRLSFSSNSFDAYIANLSLHIVPEPQDMLKEALRVLKPGATAVFSVWGKQERSNLFCILNKALSIANPTESSSDSSTVPRSPFHLNNQDNLNQLAREAGFVNIRSFYSAIPLDITSGVEFVNTYKNEPGILLLREVNQETYEAVLEELKNQADIILQGGNHLTFDFLALIAEKPFSN